MGNFSFVIMAMPTIVVLLLKQKMVSFNRIRRVRKIMNIANIFNVGLMFLYPSEIWMAYLGLLIILIGLQNEAFAEARERFLLFVEENADDFLFEATLIEEGSVFGFLTLPEKQDFVVSAKFVGNTKLEKGVKYSGVRVYLAVNTFGHLSGVYCSS